MNGTLKRQPSLPLIPIHTMITDLLLQQGFLKQELARYLGIHISKINRLLTSHDAGSLLHKYQNQRLIACYQRLFNQ